MVRSTRDAKVGRVIISLEEVKGVIQGSLGPIDESMVPANATVSSGVIDAVTAKGEGVVERLGETVRRPIPILLDGVGIFWVWEQVVNGVPVLLGVLVVLMTRVLSDADLS